MRAPAAERPVFSATTGTPRARARATAAASACGSPTAFHVQADRGHARVVQHRVHRRGVADALAWLPRVIR